MPKVKPKWINRQRLLVFASRGISSRDRHLMTDLRTLMPHSRAEGKMEKRENKSEVNELCELRNCNKVMFFESRLKRDVYMWISNVPTGPSAKFLVENIHTMFEMKLTGNCLKGSRPLLSFDKTFESAPHFMVLKELLTQIFGTPFHHPRSQPFIDHVMTFTVMDNRIWFRNYQILSEDGALSEIGPRFVLNPIKIFESSMGGRTLWDNPKYITPAKYRRMITKSASMKYEDRVQYKVGNEIRKGKYKYEPNPLEDMFRNDTLSAAKAVVEKSETDSDEEEVEEDEKEVVLKKQKRHKRKRSAEDLEIRRRKQRMRAARAKH